MKQWGLALHNHHDSNNALPAGCGQLYYFAPMVGATAFLLPYMEQTSIWDLLTNYAQSDSAKTQIDQVPGLPISLGDLLGGETLGIPMAVGIETTDTAIALRTAMAEMKPISYLLCPSDGNTREMFDISFGDGTIRVQGMNVLPCSGDAIMFNAIGDLLGMIYTVGMAVQDGGTIDPTNIGKAPATANRGLFMPFSKKNMSAASDGTSNTIAASETCVAPVVTNDYPMVKGGMIHELNPATPVTCLQARDPGNRNQLDKVNQKTGGWHFRGQAFFLGTGTNRFTTILPPNSPACSFKDTYTAGGDLLSGQNMGYQDGIHTPSSNHTGGVNAVFLDGAVRFVSDSVDYTSATPGGAWDQLPAKSVTSLLGPIDLPGGGASHGSFMAPSGQSPYGVWGALGSPSGGESKSL